MRQEGPSVEEILQSIKRVMARDEQQVRGAQGEGAPGAGLPEDQRPEPADEDEAEDVRGVSARPLPGSRELNAGEGTYASSGQAFEEDGFATEQGPSEGMTSNTSAAAMRRSLAALELLARGQGGGSQSSDTALDATVRDMLRPMLAEWLEANLPAIVERLVRAEISRITGSPV